MTKVIISVFYQLKEKSKQKTTIWQAKYCQLSMNWTTVVRDELSLFNIFEMYMFSVNFCIQNSIMIE